MPDVTCLGILVADVLGNGGQDVDGRSCQQHEKHEGDGQDQIALTQVTDPFANAGDRGQDGSSDGQQDDEDEALEGCTRQRSDFPKSGMAPKPSVVVRPKIVAQSARMSMTVPGVL